MRKRSLLLALLAAVTVACQAYPPADRTVYITEKGKKYHMKNCRLKHGSTGVKLTVAKKKGYTACAVCKPAK